MLLQNPSKEKAELNRTLALAVQLSVSVGKMEGLTQHLAAQWLPKEDSSKHIHRLLKQACMDTTNRQASPTPKEVA